MLAARIYLCIAHVLNDRLSNISETEGTSCTTSGFRNTFQCLVSVDRLELAALVTASIGAPNIYCFEYPFKYLVKRFELVETSTKVALIDCVATLNTFSADYGSTTGTLE